MPMARHLLIQCRSSVPHFSERCGNHQFPACRDSNSFGSLENETDCARVPTWTHNEVVLQQALRSVICHGYSGIDVAVFHASVGRNLGCSRSPLPSEIVAIPL